MDVQVSNQISTRCPTRHDRPEARAGGYGLVSVAGTDGVRAGVAETMDLYDAVR